MVRPTRGSKPEGSTLREALTLAGLNDLSPGTVVTYPDQHLSFPHNLLRKPHGRRFAVIVSNARICADKSVGIVVAVPMTHEVATRDATEVLIERSSENGIECDGSAMLHMIQPVLKTNIKQKMGVLNAADWDALIAGLAWMVER